MMCLQCQTDQPKESFFKTQDEYEAQRNNRFYVPESKFCHSCRQAADKRTGTDQPPEPIQVCSTCQMRFPLSSFVNKKGHLMEWCKVCRAKHVGAKRLPVNRNLGGPRRI